MSVVIHMSSTKPEKHVQAIHTYKAYLSQEQKEEILNQINIPEKEGESQEINMHVHIEIKILKK